jgi:hypothetical protein
MWVFIRPLRTGYLLCLAPPRRMRRDDGVRLSPVPAAPLARPGASTISGAAEILAGLSGLTKGNFLPSGPGSDTIPIACRPAVQFNPFYPAGRRLRPQPVLGGARRIKLIRWTARRLNSTRAYNLWASEEIT